jgi:hypothetical protein
MKTMLVAKQRALATGLRFRITDSPATIIPAEKSQKKKAFMAG